MAVISKLTGRERRKRRIRKHVTGTPERPRLAVFRSAKHIYAQVIDDLSGTTLAAASTMGKDARGKTDGKKTDVAKKVGMTLAAQCKAKSIQAVVFDRSGYRYHGRIKAIAEGAREGGLTF